MKQLKYILIAALSFTGIYFIYTISKLTFLPNKYYLPMMAITILIFIGIIYYIYKSDHIFSKILSILLTVAILLLVPKVSKLSDTLSDITGLGKETNTVLVTRL